MTLQAERKRKEARREIPLSYNNCRRSKDGVEILSIMYRIYLDYTDESGMQIFLTLMTRKSAEDESNAPL